jgi:hypothetical protein
MRFITVLDPLAVDLNTFAYVKVQMETSKIPAVADGLRHRRWFPQLLQCTGPAAIMGMILADSMATLGRLETEEPGQVDGILGACISALVRRYKVDMR